MTQQINARKHFSLFLLLGMSLGLMYLFFLNPHVDVKPFNADDSVAYLNRAKSLWEGHGYGESFVDAFFPVTLQPPAFSLLLAPLVGIFGMNFIVLKLFMLLLTILMAISSFIYFRHFLHSQTEVNSAMLLLMASPVIFGLSHQVLAEIPLFLFCMLGLVTLDRYLQTSVRIFSPVLFFSALLIATAYFFKATALGVLAGGWMLILHPKFQTLGTFKKLLLCSVLVFIPILFWQAWCSTIPKTNFWTQPAWADILMVNPYQAGSPRASLADLAVRMRHNLAWGLSANIAMGLMAPFYFAQGGVLSFVLSLPIVLWLLGSWVKSLVQKPSVLEGFTLFSIFILMIKFEGMAVRYAALLYPVLLVYVFRGFNANMNAKLQTLVPQVLSVVAIVTTLVVAVDHWNNPYGGKIVRDYISVAQKAKAIFPPHSRCYAPMGSHWQVLTEHLCFISG